MEIMLAWNRRFARAPGGGATAPETPLATVSSRLKRTIASDGSAAACPSRRAPSLGEDVQGDGYPDLAVERARGAPGARIGAGAVCVWPFIPAYLDEDGDGFVAQVSGGLDCDGVVASPVYSSERWWPCGAPIRIFTRWKIARGGRDGPLCADGLEAVLGGGGRPGKLFFATDAGTIYRI